MTTRNQMTETRDQDRQSTTFARTSDRERSLDTGRDLGTRTGLARREQPQWDLVTGMPARSPFALMRRMMDDMDRLFENFGLGGRTTPSLFDAFGTDGGPALWSPAVEVLERGDRFIVRAEIPGVSKDDVSVDVTDGVLTIEGERRQESEEQEEGYWRSERSYGRFLRSIPLPDGVDAEKAEAKFRDGVLEVTLPAPKRERKRGRKISIR